MFGTKGSSMDTTPVALNIAIAENDRATADVLSDVFSRIPHVQSTKRFDAKELAFEALREGKCNVLLVNLFSFGIKRGIDLIDLTRKEVPHVPICLIGSTAQLSLMADVPKHWQERFEHYYKLPVDQSPIEMARNAEYIARMLSLYLLSRTASIRLRDLKSFLGRPEMRDHLDAQQKRIDEAIDLAERALQAKQEAVGADRFIVPGFDSQDLQALVKDTLRKASTSLERSATVNKGLLIFGGLLVAASFVVASIKGSWEAVTFGGFGVAGIITSLIRNPLQSIAASARRLVQIQVAYLGFLNVLGTFGNQSSPQDEESMTRRAERINEAISNVLEALEKHCQ